MNSEVEIIYFVYQINEAAIGADNDSDCEWSELQELKVANDETKASMISNKTRFCFANKFNNQTTFENDYQRSSTPLKVAELVEDSVSPIAFPDNLSQSNEFRIVIPAYERLPSAQVCGTVIEIASLSQGEGEIHNTFGEETITDSITEGVFDAVYAVTDIVEEEVALEGAIISSAENTNEIQLLNTSQQADLFDSLVDHMFGGIDRSQFPEHFHFTERQIHLPRIGSGSNDDSVLFIVKKINDEQYSSDTLNRDAFTTVYNIKHNFSEIDILRLDADIDNLFGELVFQKISAYSDNDIVSVTIRHNALSSDIYVYGKKANFNIEDILSSIIEVS